MRRFLHPVFLICLIAVLLLPSAGQGQSAWKPTETIPKTDSFGGVAEETSARLSIKTCTERDELVANAVRALGRAERVARSPVPASAG